jgi:hypothetical protein
MIYTYIPRLFTTTLHAMYFFNIYMAPCKCFEMVKCIYYVPLIVKPICNPHGFYVNINTIKMTIKSNSFVWNE